MIAQAGADRDCICLDVVAWAGVAVMDRVNHGGVGGVALTDDKALDGVEPVRSGAAAGRAAKFQNLQK